MEAFERVHALWAAVIALAIKDAQGADKDLREAAWSWLFGPGEDFEHVCELVGLEPSWVRGVARRRLGIRTPGRLTRQRGGAHLRHEP